MRSHFEAALDELQSATRVQPDEIVPGVPGSLGNRPVIVLSAGKSAADPAWVEDWAEAQGRLAALSQRGKDPVFDLLMVGANAWAERVSWIEPQGD